MLTLKLLKLSAVGCQWLPHLRDEFDSQWLLNFVSQWGVNQQMHHITDWDFCLKLQEQVKHIQGHVSTLLFLIDIKDPF